MNFSLFTENQFQNLNWDNILVAGGSVLGCLEPHDAKKPKDKRNYFHKNAYKNSDIDIFFYGLNAKQANEKLNDIYETVCDSLIGGEDVICFRSQHAVTIISKFPYRHIQIILRLYKSPAEILMGFDVDACAIGFDGEDVYMTPRAHHAITKKMNTVDMTRRSPSYEMRLAKYCQRGYSILIPSLDERRIDPQIFEKRFDQVQGLAKLILITKLDSVEARYAYKDRQRSRKIRPQSKNKTSFLDLLDTSMHGDDKEYNSERLEAGACASDYSTVFLPWGPTWHANRIRKLMYTKDMILNSKWYDPKKKYHTHPCFFGTAKEIIKDCCGSCPPIPKDEIDPDSPFVSGEISWLDVNPGQQTQLKRIGSFHPITEGDWTEGTYISSGIEDLCTAVNSNDVKKLEEIYNTNHTTENPMNLNQRDYSGRTLLHIACFSNSVDTAKFLIDKGARISNKMGDGRTAIHICSQYGHYEIINFLIARGAELEEQNEKLAKEEKNNDNNGDDMDIDNSKDSDDDDDDHSKDGSDDEEDEFCIKNIVDAQKKKKEEALRALNPFSNEDSPDHLDIEEKDWDNQFTPLQFACFYGKTKAIKILIDEGGADVKILDNSKKYTTAMLAIFNGHINAVKLLLKKGYPFSHVNKKFVNALEFACSYLNYDIIKTLIHSQKKEKNPVCTYQCLDNIIDAIDEDSDDGHYYYGHDSYSSDDHNQGYGGYGNNSSDDNEELNQDQLEAEERKKNAALKCFELLLQNKAPLFSNTETGDDDEDDSDSDSSDSDSSASEKKKKTKSKDSGEEQIRKEVGNNGAFTTKGECILSRVIKEKEFLKLILDHDPTVVNLCDGTKTPLDLINKEIKTLKQQESNDDDDEDEAKHNFKNLRSIYEESYSYYGSSNSTKLENLVPLKECETIINALKNQYKTEKKSQIVKECIEDAITEIYKFLNETFRTNSSVPKLAKKFMKQSENIEKQSKTLHEIQSILLAHNAKGFLEIRFTDKEMKKLFTKKKKNIAEKAKLEKQRKAKKNNKKSKKKQSYDSSDDESMDSDDSEDSEKDNPLRLPVLKYIPIMEGRRKNTYFKKDDLKKEKKQVHQLFDAILTKNKEKITTLTVKQKIGKQVHICWAVTYSNFPVHRISPTTLMMAMKKNYPDILCLLLDISTQQFTPLIAKKKKEGDSFIPTINNHELLKLMNQNIKPGDYLDTSGKSVHKVNSDDYEENDPNAKSLTKMNCTTSPSSILLYSSDGYNIMHIAAYYNCIESTTALFDYINSNKIEYYHVIDSDDDDDNKNSRHILNSDATSKDILLKELLQPKEPSPYNSFTTIRLPFHVAVIFGHIDMITILIENGGVEYISEDDLPEIYTGLDVGGQKMDWALDHHSDEFKSKPKKRTQTACILASYFNQPKSLEFLVKKAPAIWKKYYKNTFPDRDIPDTPDEFNLKTRFKYDYNALHVCCFWLHKNDIINGVTAYDQNNKYQQNAGNPKEDYLSNVESRTDAAKMILDLDNELYGNTLINSTTKQEGLTPLMIASYFNNVEIVQLLLSKKSSIVIDYQCTARGWTALHYAAYNNSLDVVKILIPHFSKSQADLKSKEFSQTALTIAALRKNHEIVKFLTQSGKCDIFAKDTGGDYPLHYSIRARDFESVKLFINANSDNMINFLRENGVNQSVLDIAMLILIKIFRNHEALGAKNTRLAATQILKLIYDNLGYERYLSQYKYIASVTEVLIQQTIQQCNNNDNANKKDKHGRKPALKGNWSHIFTPPKFYFFALAPPFQNDKCVSGPISKLNTKQFIPYDHHA